MMKFILPLVFILLQSCAHIPTQNTPCYHDLRRHQVIETECLCCDVSEFECGPECVEPCFNNHFVEVPVRDLEPRDFNPLPFDTHGYKIIRGDTFEIQLFGEEEARLETVVVANDGNIYYSLLSGVPAEGRSIQEVVDDFQERLKTYFIDPRLTMTPRFLSGMAWRILGRVYKPGLYPLRYPLTLRGAIGESGGLITEVLRYRDIDRSLRTTANLDASFVVRDGKKLNIDFANLLFSADNSDNVYIKPGDYIYIAPREKQEVYVLGNVRTPRTVPFVKGLSLLGALANATGWESSLRPYGPNLRRVIILRGSLCNPKVICADVKEILDGCGRDVFLCAGDIVFVTNKPFRLVREIIRLAIESYIFGFAATAGQYYAEKVVPFPSLTNGLNNGANN